MLVDNIACFLVSWLQETQNTQHEIPIKFTFPSVERACFGAPQEAINPYQIWDFEVRCVNTEFLDVVSEQKVSVNAVLDVLGQLLKNGSVFIGYNSKVLVVLPPVGEQVSYSYDEVFTYLGLPVEVNKHVQEVI